MPTPRTRWATRITSPSSIRYDLMMVEQPLEYDDVADHARLQRRIRTPICLDESIHTVKTAEEAIDAGACRIINIKPGRVGGHAESIRLHDVCAARGIPVWHGGMLESGIGRAHNIHLSTLPNFSLPGDIAASRRYFAPGSASSRRSKSVPTARSRSRGSRDRRDARSGPRRPSDRTPADAQRPWSELGARPLWAAALAASACATAPPAQRTPVVPIEQKLASIVRLEDRRVLRDEPPPAAQTTPPPKQRGRQKPEAPPPVPDLRRLLTDPEPRVRYRAALAIGRVGLADGIAPLTAALADTSAEVRQMSAFALGLIGDRAAVPVLTKALADPDWLVRGRAAEALGLIGDASAAGDVGALAKEAASAGRIASMAPDTDADATAGNVSPVEPPADAFRLALYALVRLKAYEPLSAAVTGADGQPVGRWWPIAYALQRIEDPRAGAALLELARGPGRYTIAFAARGLGSIKHRRRRQRSLAARRSKTNRFGDRSVRRFARSGRSAASLRSTHSSRSSGNGRSDPDLRLEAVTALGALRAPLRARPCSIRWRTNGRRCAPRRSARLLRSIRTSSC